MTRNKFFIIFLISLLFINIFSVSSFAAYQTHFEVDGNTYDVIDYSEYIDSDNYCIIKNGSKIYLFVCYAEDSYFSFALGTGSSKSVGVRDCKYYYYYSAETRWIYQGYKGIPTPSTSRYNVLEYDAVLYSSFDVRDWDTGEIVFEGFKENFEDIYNNQVDNVLSSSSDKYSDMANNIAGGDFSSSLDEEDKTTVSSAANKVGKGFDGIFGIFSFIDSVKNAVGEIYKLLVSIPHLDDNTSSGFPIIIPVESPYLSGSGIDLRYMLDIYTKSWVKEFVDNVIVGFAYLGFIWRAFKNLSNTIRGVETSTLDSFNVSKNSKD